MSNSFKRISLYSGNNNLTEFIYNVLEEYKDVKTSELVDLLHSNESAWSHVKPNDEISDELIKKYKY